MPPATKVKVRRWAVLGYLVEHGREGASVASIAESMNLDRKTVRKIMRELGDADLVKFNRDDSRAVRAETPETQTAEGRPSHQETLFGSVAQAPPPAKTNGKPTMSPQFLRWYKAYPVKRNRAQAWEWWRKHKLDGHVDALLKALAWQQKRKKELKDKGEFVEEFAHANRYIRHKRWHDQF